LALITLTFEGQLRYRRAPGFLAPSPLIEVTLHYNGESTPRFPALLDTGSTRTLFKEEFAESLGIGDLSTFQSIVIRTGGGSLTAYLVDVELEFVLDRKRFGCQVGFANLPRNILGRDIAFSKYLLAFDEKKEFLYYGESS
jgi:hypothetical protein